MLIDVVMRKIVQVKLRAIANATRSSDAFDSTFVDSVQELLDLEKPITLKQAQAIDNIWDKWTQDI